MPNITISLEDGDLDRIAHKVLSKLQPMLERITPGRDEAPGVEVLSRAEAARVCGVSQRQLIRLETRGESPRARRISPGRIGYLRHELEGQPAAAVIAGSRRVLNRSSLAQKLGLNARTLARILDQLPPANAEGEWYEREIDEWLLKTPQARGRPDRE